MKKSEKNNFRYFPDRPEIIQASADIPVLHDETDNIHDKRKRLDYVERKKSRSQSISMSIFVVFVMIITVIVVLKIMKSSDPKPQFMFIQEGVIEHTITSEGLFIREETVLRSPDNGYLKPLIQAGSRVSSGQTAAVIMKDGSDDHMVTLKNYEKQISDLQNELMKQGKGPGARAVYDEADKEISAQIDIIRHDAINGLSAGISSNRSSISIAIQRRESRLLSIDFNDTRLNELKTQKQLLEEGLEVVTGNIFIETPGIVSYHIDGQEEILNADSAGKMSIDDYKKYLLQDKGNYTVGEYIEKDAAALKIITGIYQQIAVLIPAQQDSEFAEDSVHVLSVPEKGVQISGCRVVRKLVQGEEVLVILTTDRQLSGFSDHRSVVVSISTRTTSGLRIPYSSLYDIANDGKSGDLMIVVNGYAKKIPVTIKDHDSEYAIIEAANEADKNTLLNGYLVKNPGSVEEGEDLGT